MSFFGKMVSLATLLVILAACGTTTQAPLQPAEVIKNYTANVVIDEKSSCPWDYLKNKVPTYTGVFFSTQAQASRVAQAIIAGQPTGVSPQAESRCVGPVYKVDEFQIGTTNYVIVGGTDHSGLTSTSTTAQGGGPQSFAIIAKADYELNGLNVQRGLVLDWFAGRTIDQRGGTTKLFALNGVWTTGTEANANSIQGLLEQNVFIKMPLNGWQKTEQKTSLYEGVLLNEVNINTYGYTVGWIKPQGDVTISGMQYVIFIKTP